MAAYAEYTCCQCAVAVAHLLHGYSSISLYAYFFGEYQMFLLKYTPHVTSQIYEAAESSIAL